MNLKNIYIEQHDSNDCAVACLAMVCKYYKKDVTLTKLRDILGTDIQGTPINGLHHGAEQIGFEAKKIRITKGVIHENITLPAICHVITSEGTSHFVVLQNVLRKKVIVLDPAKGIVKYSIDEFFDFFDGLMLLLYPNIEFKKTKSTKETTLHKFIELLKPQKKLFIFAIIGSIILTALSLFSSLFNKVLMDEILPYALTDLIIAYSIGFGIVVLIRVILSAVRQHLVLYLSQRIDLPLMLGYFRHVFNLPIKFFASRKIGDITTRFQDAFVIKEILTNTMLTVIIDILLAIIAVIIMLCMSWKLFVVILTITILSAVLIYTYKGIYKRLNKKQMEQNARLNSKIIEGLNGIDTVKANACEKSIMDGVESEYVKTLKVGFKQGFHTNIQNSFSQIIAGLGNIVLMALGVYFSIQGELTIGTVLAFFTIAGFFMEPIGRLIELQTQIQEAGISLKRLSEIQDIDEEEEQEFGRECVEKINSDIILKNITFRYGSRAPILKNINIKIPQGNKIALVGESGCGKTTVSKLLLKFYEAEEGEILFGDKEISNLNAFSIRREIGYVPQDVEMFSGSIIDNIRVGKEDASEEDIKYICKKSGCSKFIDKMPFGYKTFLDANGGGLSGGEKQRLAIARAFVKNPSFVILDEATSGLDFNTEMEMFDFLFNKNKDTTMLIIAHRLNTIKHCDCIYVMSNGEIVESGKHDELISKHGFYEKLWETQFDYEKKITKLTEKTIKKTEEAKIIGDNEIEY